MKCVEILNSVLLYGGRIIETPLCILDNGDYLYLRPLVYVDKEAKEKVLVGVFPFIFGKPIPVSGTIKIIMPDGKLVELTQKA